MISYIWTTDPYLPKNSELLRKIDSLILPNSIVHSTITHLDYGLSRYEYILQKEVEGLSDIIDDISYIPLKINSIFKDSYTEHIYLIEIMETLLSKFLSMKNIHIVRTSSKVGTNEILLTFTPENDEGPILLPYNKIKLLLPILDPQNYRDYKLISQYAPSFVNYILYSPENNKDYTMSNYNYGKSILIPYHGITVVSLENYNPDVHDDFDRKFGNMFHYYNSESNNQELIYDIVRRFGTIHSKEDNVFSLDNSLDIKEKEEWLSRSLFQIKEGKLPTVLIGGTWQHQLDITEDNRETIERFATEVYVSDARYKQFGTIKVLPNLLIIASFINYRDVVSFKRILESKFGRETIEIDVKFGVSGLQLPKILINSEIKVIREKDETIFEVKLKDGNNYELLTLGKNVNSEIVKLITELWNRGWFLTPWSFTSTGHKETVAIRYDPKLARGRYFADDTIEYLKASII